MSLHLRKIFLGCILTAAMMGGTSCSSYKSALYMQESDKFNETSKSQLYDFRIRKIFLGCILTAAMMGGTSCSSYKSALYMQESDKFNETSKSQLYDFRIMPKDELTILVSTTDPEASAPFIRKFGQSKEFGGASTTGMQNTNLLSYLVDNNGCIDFPVLGMVKVVGMTTRECEAHFRELLKPYLKEVPNVTVSTSNYKFSVLGEVGAPGTYSTTNEKMTVFEALALAGDMTLFSVRDNVQLMREDFSVLGEVGAPGTYSTTNEKMTVFEALALAGDMTLFSVRDNVQLMREDATGKRRIYTLDLTQADIANSPYFYIQQNDVLYVKPTKSKVYSNTFNTNASMWLTLLSLVTSVTTLVIALTR